MSGENYWCSLSMDDYLTDIGRTSGSDLTNVDIEPERYGLRLAGKHVDRPTAATGRGTLTHFMALEGGNADLIRERFAFYPNRTALIEEEKAIPEGINPRTGEEYKTAKATGNMIAQDASPEGERHKIKTQSKSAKRYAREFMETAQGRTIVYPEDQPIVNAMVRALRNHEHAREYLGQDMEPEVTGHWTCPVTGEHYRIRPDGMLLRRRVLVELKTVATKGERRLEASDPRWAVRMAHEGWARKDAMLHDGFRAIEGEPCTVVWLIVEAREDDPRVFVKVSESTGGARSFFYEVGRSGNPEWGVKGYLQLTKEARQYRVRGDFRPDGVREVGSWEFTGGFMNSLEFVHDEESTEVASYG